MRYDARDWLWILLAVGVSVATSSGFDPIPELEGTYEVTSDCAGATKSGTLIFSKSSGTSSGDDDDDEGSGSSETPAPAPAPTPDPAPAPTPKDTSAVFKRKGSASATGATTFGFPSDNFELGGEKASSSAGGRTCTGLVLDVNVPNLVFVCRADNSDAVDCTIVLTK